MPKTKEQKGEITGKKPMTKRQSKGTCGARKNKPLSMKGGGSWEPESNTKPKELINTEISKYFMKIGQVDQRDKGGADFMGVDQEVIGSVSIEKDQRID